ncbi:hypothetical protein AUK40_03080 [Candidatus Wirthbacteria bacterium CG2_30_54_11]|uniref:GGDEF domain-containing protein n=1 Tax=Candidatus Wirthbacteria bacterium CG2_30_54_11 TaxID=1817892 RepID=A0A1J5IK22_9BACT|nr:MAG: hypothetical protein AUK40_03080 [Candidatus Wirthbacteria bacterium CG2_30_54_11]
MESYLDRDGNTVQPLQELTRLAVEHGNVQEVVDRAQAIIDDLYPASGASQTSGTQLEIRIPDHHDQSDLIYAIITSQNLTESTRQYLQVVITNACQIADRVNMLELDVEQAEYVTQALSTDRETMAAIKPKTPFEVIPLVRELIKKRIAAHRVEIVMAGGYEMDRHLLHDNLKRFMADEHAQRKTLRAEIGERKLGNAVNKIQTYTLEKLITSEGNTIGLVIIEHPDTGTTSDTHVDDYTHEALRVTEVPTALDFVSQEDMIAHLSNLKGAAEKFRDSHAFSYDALTGVHNRAAGRGLIEQRIKNLFSATQSGEPEKPQETTPPRSLVHIAFDIDFFSMYNNRFDHDVGDKILEAIGSLIRQLSRDKGSGEIDVTIARVGGEEFELLINGPMGDAMKYISRINEYLARPDLRASLESGDPFEPAIKAARELADAQMERHPTGEKLPSLEGWKHSFSIGVTEITEADLSDSKTNNDDIEITTPQGTKYLNMQAVRKTSDEAAHTAKSGELSNGRDQTVIDLKSNFSPSMIYSTLCRSRTGSNGASLYKITPEADEAGYSLEPDKTYAQPLIKWDQAKNHDAQEFQTKLKSSNIDAGPRSQKYLTDVESEADFSLQDVLIFEPYQIDPPLLYQVIIDSKNETLTLRPLEWVDPYAAKPGTSEAFRASRKVETDPASALAALLASYQPGDIAEALRNHPNNTVILSALKQLIE